MKIKSYTHNPIFGFVILTLSGVCTPVLTRAETHCGLAALLCLNAGTLNEDHISTLPAIWIDTFEDHSGGWKLSLDYANPFPKDDSDLNRASRTAIWLERTSEVRLFARRFRLGGGLGFGLWSLSAKSGHSYRGSMGYIGEIESKIETIRISGLTFGLGYSGLNVPGTGLVDDVVYLRVQYQLFSWK